MILIVDDSLFMRNHLKKFLEEAHFTEIIEAENGVQAIDMYKAYSPEIVIMDVIMPILSGMDALKEILKIDPHAKVIMCTALGGQRSFVIEGLKAGAKDFIIKPYFHNLIAIVKKHYNAN